MEEESANFNRPLTRLFHPTRLRDPVHSPVIGEKDFSRLIPEYHLHVIIALFGPKSPSLESALTDLTVTMT